MEEGRVSSAWVRGKRDQDVCYDSAEAQKPFFLKVIWEWNGVCLLADMLHYCLVFAHASHSSL